MLTIFWIGLLRLRNEEARPTFNKFKKNTDLVNEQSDLPTKDYLPYVSVVVAARNEENTLLDCLRPLLAQSYSNKRYEVIIVDDHSTDNTYAIARDFAIDYPNLKVLKSDNFQLEDAANHKSRKTKQCRTPTGKQIALDMGIQSSCGELILSTDADCIVPHTWIENMVKGYEQEVGVMVGFSMLDERCLDIGEYSKESPVKKKYSYRFRDSLFIKLQSLELLSLFSAFAGGLKMGVAFACTGNNLGYRRQVYDELGEFVNLGFTVAEDNMFIQWVDRCSKWQIQPICHPGVTVLTRPMKTVKDFLRQRLRWASNSIGNRISLVCFMVIVYGFYLFLPVVLLFAAFGLLSWTITLVIFSLKLIPEFLLVSKGLKLFDRMDLLKYFLLLEPFQMIYVLICGIFGLLCKVVWKGRKFERTAEGKEQRAENMML